MKNNNQSWRNYLQYTRGGIYDESLDNDTFIDDDKKYIGKKALQDPLNVGKATFKPAMDEVINWITDPEFADRLTENFPASTEVTKLDRLLTTGTDKQIREARTEDLLNSHRKYIPEIVKNLQEAEFLYNPDPDINDDLFNRYSKGYNKRELAGVQETLADNPQGFTDYDNVSVVRNRANEENQAGAASVAKHEKIGHVEGAYVGPIDPTTLKRGFQTFDNAYADKFANPESSTWYTSKKTGKIVRPDKTEFYPFLMQLRLDNKMQPGEIIDDARLDAIRKSGSTNPLLRHYKNDKLLKYLNTFASNKTQEQPQQQMQPQETYMQRAARGGYYDKGGPFKNTGYDEDLFPETQKQAEDRIFKQMEGRISPWDGDMNVGFDHDMHGADEWINILQAAGAWNGQDTMMRLKAAIPPPDYLTPKRKDNMLEQYYPPYKVEPEPGDPRDPRYVIDPKNLNIPQPSYEELVKSKTVRKPPEAEYAQGGYTNPYNQYQKDPYLQYKVGGKVWQDIGSGAYGVLQGTLGTVTGGLTDPLMDIGYQGLQKAANKDFDPNDPEDVKAMREINTVGGAGQIGGAVLGGIVSGNVGSAVAEGASGTNKIIQSSTASDSTKQWSQGLNSLAQMGHQMNGMSSGSSGSGSGAGAEGAAANVSAGSTIGTGAAGEGASSFGDIMTNFSSSNFGKDAKKAMPYINQAAGMASGNKGSLLEQGVARQDYLNSPEYLALKKQGDITVNNGITFSQGGNITNNSLNLRNTMRYKRFAQGGTFDQYGINMIPDSAGLHHESAYGGVPIGPNALAEGGEIKMDTGDGGQYIVSDQVDGAESQKDFMFSKGGKYKELNRTLADGMKQDLSKYTFGSLATSDRVKGDLRRPNDSYGQSTVEQIKQKWQQKTEYARQRSQQVQAIAQAEEQKRMAEEQYIAAYGGRINPKKYPGLNMTKKAKGGYVYNPMTQPMLATGGPIYGDPASEYVYARGGQIDYTNDVYSSYAGGGPMVSNIPQGFRGPSAQNRGGMYIYPDGGMMPPEQQMMQEQQMQQQQAPQEQMQQQGGQDQMMQMVQQVIEALMQGAQPEQIMQQLMQSGVPQEQAQQIVQMAMQEAQGQQQQQQQQPMQGQEQQMPPQQGMADGGMMQQSDTINKIAQALQQGGQPEQILQQLVQSGMPQEQAVAMVQQVMSQMQQPQQQAAPQQGMMARGGKMYYAGGPDEPLPGMYDLRLPMTIEDLNKLSLNDVLNNEYKLPELPNTKYNQLQKLPPSKPVDMSIYNEESVPGVDASGREVSWNPALLEDYDENGNKISVNPNTLGEDWESTRQQTGAGTGTETGQNTKGSSFSVLDAVLGAAQLAGPLDQYIKGSKYDRVKYPKVTPDLLNPTAAIATMTQEQQRAQDTAGYGIRQQAPTSGSYLANIRANALQFGKQRGVGAANIRGQYDLQNTGIQNQFKQYNNSLTIEGMRDEASNKGAAATNQTDALYNAAANLTGMRKDYKQGEIDKTIADNIGTNNWKLSSDGKLVIFRDTKTGNIVTKPISDIQQGG